MSNAARRFATLVFALIAIFLTVYTWLPSRDSLERAEARVTGIAAQANTWHEVEITTSDGTRLTCRTRRGWPLIGPSLCPLEKFEALRGQGVSVAHDGRRPYEVVAGSQVIVDYSAHRRTQAIAITLAGLMLAMAVLVWRRRY
jgi:hypothetical protein